MDRITCGVILTLGISSECGNLSTVCKFILTEFVSSEFLLFLSKQILILAQSNVDLSVFDDLPPPLCRAGPDGALFRIGCDDDGFPTGDITNTTIPVPTPSPKDVVHGKDIKRAEEKVPRGHYKGVDFAEMSDILNGWLNTSTLTKPCLDWDVEELQQLQALFYLARESQFDDIYIRTGDNRRLRNDVLADLASNWAGLNNIAKTHSDYRYRDHR